MQLLTWPFGILAVEYGGLKYPSRFLADAVGTSLTYEFLAYPAVGALFNLYYPKGRPWLYQTLYLFAYTSILTVGEVILERYTELVHYLHWNWFASWITILLTLLMNYLWYNWFFFGRNARADVS